MTMAATSTTHCAKQSKLKFAALGGIWLDEICAPGKDTLVDVPGGSVAFATFGALLFSLQTPQSIGLIVKAGHDFPVALERTFTEWNLDLHILRDNDRPSSRGRILYAEDASDRKYQRLTSPLPSTTRDLETTDMISADCFHFFDIAEAVSTQIGEIEAMRTQQGIHSRPLYVWEPQAKSCSLQTFECHKAVLEEVDIFSPNHAELASFFAETSGGAVVFDKATIEEQARAFMPSTITRPLCIIIRCADQSFIEALSPTGHMISAISIMNVIPPKLTRYRRRSIELIPPI